MNTSDLRVDTDPTSGSYDLVRVARQTAISRAGKLSRSGAFVATATTSLETGRYVTVVEMKAIDWDRTKPTRLLRNLSAHRRQVWRYVERNLDGEKLDVSAGIIYPAAPGTPGPP